MEIKTTEEEREYREVLDEYYGLLNSLRKKFDLRPYWYSDIWNGTKIKIVYKVSRKQEKIICSIHMDDSMDAMRIAIRDLKYFQEMNRT